MNQGYLRPLIDNLLTERFAEGILGLKGNAKAIAATKIMQAELHLATMTLKPTLRFKNTGLHNVGKILSGKICVNAF